MNQEYVEQVLTILKNRGSHGYGTRHELYAAMNAEEEKDISNKREAWSEAMRIYAQRFEQGSINDPRR